MSETRDPTTREDARVAIANRLRTAREMAGLSQGQVARLLGIHRPTVTETEAGRRKVSAEELAAFAHLYGVGVAWLAGEEGTSAPEDPEIELAARELGKLKPEDRKKVLDILSALRGRRTAP